MCCLDIWGRKGGRGMKFRHWGWKGGGGGGNGRGDDGRGRWAVVMGMVVSGGVLRACG